MFLSWRFKGMAKLDQSVVRFIVRFTVTPTPHPFCIVTVGGMFRCLLFPQQHLKFQVCESSGCKSASVTQDVLLAPNNLFSKSQDRTSPPSPFSDKPFCTASFALNFNEKPTTRTRTRSYQIVSARKLVREVRVPDPKNCGQI